MKCPNPKCGQEIDRVDYLCDKTGTVEVEEDGTINWETAVTNNEENHKPSCYNCGCPLKFKEIPKKDGGWTYILTGEEG